MVGQPFEESLGDADHYRKQEQFCVQMSETVPTEEVRVRWLNVAQQWRELADAAEQRGRV